MLQQMSMVEPCVDIHYRQLHKKYPTRGNNSLLREHNARFTHWLKNYWYGRDPKTKKVVIFLSQECSSTSVTFQSYDINGYTFYMEPQDKKKHVLEQHDNTY